MKFWKSNHDFYEKIMKPIIYPSFIVLQQYRLKLEYYFTDFSYELGPYYKEDDQYLLEKHPRLKKEWFKIRDIIMNTDIRYVIENYVGGRLGVFMKTGKTKPDPMDYFFLDKTLYIATTHIATLNQNFFERITHTEYINERKKIVVSRPYYL